MTSKLTSVPELSRSEYLLIRKEDVNENLSNHKNYASEIGPYVLLANKNFDMAQNNNFQLVLVGNIFSGEFPDKTNNDIINDLSRLSSYEEILISLRYICGRYVLFFSAENDFRIVADAFGQSEIFYADDFSVIASNVPLLSILIQTEEWTNEGNELYKRIKQKHLPPIGNTTRYKNVKHLLPNHYLSLKKSSQIRYFPTADNPVEQQDLKTVVPIMAKRLQGFAKSFSKRSKLALPITAGYDSRLLLAAFKEIDLKTFIFQFPEMPDSFYDLRIAKQITKEISRDFEIIKFDKNISPEGLEYFNLIREKPAYNRIYLLINGRKKHFQDALILNGMGGEVGRTFYHNITNVNAKKLAALLGHSYNKFVEQEMEEWLSSVDVNYLGKENILDLFYWEMRMGNWGAKSLSESAYVSNMVSPMVSQAFLAGFLSVPKKYRKRFNNKVFDGLINHMDPRLSKFPVNPYFKSTIIKTMLKLGVYNLYTNLRLKLLISSKRA